MVVRPALEATADDVLAADGYLLGTPANFGYMSGALKHFFDSTFLAVGGSLSDTGAADTGAGGRGRAVRAVRARPLRHHRARSARCSRSSGALGWRQGYGVLEVLGDVTGTDREAAYELGGTLAALVAERG